MEKSKKFRPVLYLQEAKSELLKVHWPSKKDTLRYSLFIIGLSLGVAIYFSLLDWIFTLGFEAFISLGN